MRSAKQRNTETKLNIIVSRIPYSVQLPEMYSIMSSSMTETHIKYLTGPSFKTVLNDVFNFR